MLFLSVENKLPTLHDQLSSIEGGGTLSGLATKKLYFVFPKQNVNSQLENINDNSSVW